MKLYGNTFQKLCWRLKRDLQHNRKPILLLFGNGYESQLLFTALHKLRKKFSVIHVADKVLSAKTRRILFHFKQHHLILRPDRKNHSYKTFYGGDVFTCEDIDFGFSAKDYFIIAGFKLSEPSLIKGYMRGSFKNLYCPLLRYSDEWIETLYQDMKDNEQIGEFMFDNLESDSHHNITIN